MVQKAHDSSFVVTPTSVLIKKTDRGCVETLLVKSKMKMLLILFLSNFRNDDSRHSPFPPSYLSKKKVNSGDFSLFVRFSLAP